MIKIIWSYWNTNNKPDIVQAAINSWYENANGWNIIILSDTTLHKYLNKSELPSNFETIEQTKGIQFKSDLIRLLLLYKYGGLWIDASVFLTKDIKWIIDKTIKENITDFTGFKIKNKKYMENWFIYVPYKTNKQIKKLYDILADVAKYDNVTDHKIYDFKLFNSNKFKKYFITYQAYYYLLQTNNDFKMAHNNANIININITTINVFKIVNTINRLLNTYSNKNNHEHFTLHNEKVVKLTRSSRVIYKYRILLFTMIYIVIIVFVLFFVWGCIKLKRRIE